MNKPLVAIIAFACITHLGICDEISNLYTPTTDKYVIINKTEQVLYAYEGKKLIFKCRVSTGKYNGSTPIGKFNAGEKSLMHYSHRYHNAPMPFSVHVNGNIFIHGYSDVPNYPASHGCIRVPLNEGNPAKQFFYWVELGTPIEIIGAWQK